MKLKYVHIKNYKNLIDTKINFQDKATPIAIIGNNGTGKSNLIEALLHIFMGLYYDDDPAFDYEIQYEAHGKLVEIVACYEAGPRFLQVQIKVNDQEWSRAHFKNRIRDTGNMPPFPALVFGYYSGTCNRVEKQLKRYNRTYASKLRRQSNDLQRNFIFSDVDQARWILLSLLAHGHDSLLRNLNISDIQGLTITVRPPKTYKAGSSDVRLWDSIEGIRDFLSILDNYSDDSREVRGTEFEEYITKERTYIYHVGPESEDDQLGNMGEALRKRDTNFYNMLLALSANGMLVDVNYDLRHINGVTSFSFEQLSEGEKQLLCVIGGLTMAQHEECLVLLDEPDTHLNPTWSWRYNSLLEEALHSDQLDRSTVLLATHDPVLISGLVKEQVLIATSEDGRLRYDYPHRDPRGQGVANVLTSEFFGLPSSLDQYTQGLLDERLQLAYRAKPLTYKERRRLKEINNQLAPLGLTISFRDPLYKELEERKYKEGVRE